MLRAAYAAAPWFAGKVVMEVVEVAGEIVIAVLSVLSIAVSRCQRVAMTARVAVSPTG